jgi:site-specific DNA recombinase
LVALQDKMLQPELIEEFSQEFTREMNRLRMEHRASASHARLERATVDREIAQVIRAIREGFAGPELKATMNALQARKVELDGQLAATQVPVPLLHPNMADVYRAKVEELRACLEREDSRAQAAEAIRALIEGIVLTPEGDGLKIVLKGNLAAMLGAAQNAKRSPETGDLSLLRAISGVCMTKC